MTHHLTFIPIVERNSSGYLTKESIDGAEYGRFLVTMHKAWLNDPHEWELRISNFDTALQSQATPGQSGLCVFDKTCGRNLAIEHNGDVFSCDHFVGADFKLGNINEGYLGDIANSPKQEKFGNAKLKNLPECCLKCEVLDFCNGGCPKDRFDIAPNGEYGLNHLCAGYKMWFAYINEYLKEKA